MSEPIRIGPTHLPGCSWWLGCDGYGIHGKRCPRSPDYDPNYLDVLAREILAATEGQRATEKTMAERKGGVLNPAERKRTYIYPNGETREYRNVTRLEVSESGNHYLDADGVKAIVAPGWRAIELDVDGWTF